MKADVPWMVSSLFHALRTGAYWTLVLDWYLAPVDTPQRQMNNDLNGILVPSTLFRPGLPFIHPQLTAIYARPKQLADRCFTEHETAYFDRIRWFGAIHSSSETEKINRHFTLLQATRTAGVRNKRPNSCFSTKHECHYYTAAGRV